MTTVHVCAPFFAAVLCSSLLCGCDNSTPENGDKLPGGTSLPLGKADFAGSVIEQGPIQFEDSIEEVSISAGEYHRYTFSARDGACLDVELTATKDKKPDTYLFVSRTSGTGEAIVVAEDDDGGDGLNSRIEGLTLEAGGAYELIATSYAGAGAGAYDLSLSCCNDACEPEVESDDPFDPGYCVGTPMSLDDFRSLHQGSPSVPVDVVWFDGDLRERTCYDATGHCEPWRARGNGALRLPVDGYTSMSFSGGYLQVAYYDNAPHLVLSHKATYTDWDIHGNGTSRKFTAGVVTPYDGGTVSSSVLFQGGHPAALKPEPTKDVTWGYSEERVDVSGVLTEDCLRLTSEHVSPGEDTHGNATTTEYELVLSARF